jgi:hypothetical protein
MIPSITGSLVLCFDRDFDVNIISQSLGIEPTEAKRLSETRINPITKHRNCGYWRIETRKFMTFDSKEVQDALLDLLSEKMNAIRDVFAEYQGTAIFRFFIEAEPSNEPVIMFNEDFINATSQLNAKLDVVIDIPFYYSDELEVGSLHDIENNQTIVIRKRE